MRIYNIYASQPQPGEPGCIRIEASQDLHAQIMETAIRFTANGCQVMMDRGRGMITLDVTAPAEFYGDWFEKMKKLYRDMAADNAGPVDGAN